MELKRQISGGVSILEGAIYVGLVAVFFAVSVPLIQGACLKRQTAECARKVMWAVDAFDFYADEAGQYPPVEAGSSELTGHMKRAFAAFNIDWWAQSTELGGTWSWFRAKDNTGFIAISNPRASEQDMRQLDRLIDDGDLDAGAFRRYASTYCYILKHAGHRYADT